MYSTRSRSRSIIGQFGSGSDSVGFGVDLRLLPHGRRQEFSCVGQRGGQGHRGQKEGIYIFGI